MPARNPPAMPPPPEGPDRPLPIPTRGDVDRFVGLYRDKYGGELSLEKAHEVLGGLMRFLYLTGGNREAADEEPSADGRHKEGLS